jgi:hypothetical protein
MVVMTFPHHTDKAPDPRRYAEESAQCDWLDAMGAEQ